MGLGWRRSAAEGAAHRHGQADAHEAEHADQADDRDARDRCDQLQGPSAIRAELPATAVGGVAVLAPAAAPLTVPAAAVLDVVVRRGPDRSAGRRRVRDR